MAELSIRRAAEKVLANCDFVSLASITEEGYPRICELEKVLTEGITCIYFITLKSSYEVKHFRLNSKSSVGFCLDNDSVSLMGNVRIVDDKSAKQENLPDDYMERLRKKDSIRYCILKFETLVAKVFIDETLKN